MIGIDENNTFGQSIGVDENNTLGIDETNTCQLKLYYNYNRQKEAFPAP